jgi:hypothetical protein
LVLLLAACPAACSSDSSLISDTNVETPVQTDTANLLLLRTARWPGGGRELTVGVLNGETGAPFAADLSSRIVVEPPAGLSLGAKVVRKSLPPGYTALLLPPSLGAAERASLAQAILDFVARRPAEERIALYRHGATVQLFANFLLDRTKLTEALTRYKQGVDGDPAPLPSLQAIGPVVSDVQEVGGEGPDVMRTLIVLSPDPRSVYTAFSGALVLAVPPDAAGLAAAAATLDDVRQNAFYKVAACSADPKFKARLLVRDMAGELSATLPATLPEEVGLACNLESIDSAKRVFSPRIEFVFNEVQRTAYDARIRATQSGTSYNEALARSDFEVQVRLAPGQSMILASAHLHGQSSLSCARKSYTLQLPGPARYLLPDSATDEFTLVSMCDDPAYVYAPTVFDLFNDDLFRLKRRFIELVIDGQTKGIYLLLEKTREELVRDSARVSSVMRRGYPSGGSDFFEVDYSDNGDLAAPLARFSAFRTQIAPLTGDPLVSALREQLDLDQYLRWLASESILRSGDYIDEVFFIGSEQANGKGGSNETYRIMAWDPEGFTTCHSNGANAYLDPNELSYCAEGMLDKKLLPDAKVYALFANQLEAAMNGSLSRDRFVGALTQTRNTLQSLLTVPAVCAAMVELLKYNAGAADCAVARSVLTSRTDALISAYDTRRTFLVSKLAAYRAKQ